MKAISTLTTIALAGIAFGIIHHGAFGEESERQKQIKAAAARMEERNKERRTKVKEVKKTTEEWKKELSAEQYRILREKGTERAYTGKYDEFFRKGVYKCAGCGAVLFSSDHKYDSGCGWPAFHKAADKVSVSEHLDTAFGWIRTEVTCTACGGHLGHVFDDGPRDKGGIRYCINSASLKFEENGAEKSPKEEKKEAEKDEKADAGSSREDEKARP